ncbi:MAG: transposase [Clostridia bacterium]|jgi:putative transposase
MPRAARKVSKTGIYHIMIRGINQGAIFIDERDKGKFLDIMKMIKEEGAYDLYAYCLMNNHAHFLIKEAGMPVSLLMKKLCGSYAGWFNYRHGRMGHLFQDRFKSERVETDSYFRVVLKYILNNPVL